MRDISWFTTMTTAKLKKYPPFWDFYTGLPAVHFTGHAWVTYYPHAILHSFPENYKDLHKWSVENYSKFWEEVWHFADVKHSTVYSNVRNPF